MADVIKLEKENCVIRGQQQNDFLFAKGRNK